ncbi:hypothetical protein [Lysobacter sp. HA35]
MSNSFEILFITEGEECSPAAEIQFAGQRLCVVRLSDAGPKLQFDLQGYVGRPPPGDVPLDAFMATVRLAAGDLADWSDTLAVGPEEA